jgi:hypothetical protein
MIKDIIVHYWGRHMTDEDGTDEVTLTLTQAEAEALNSLAIDAAYRRFAGLDSDDALQFIHGPRRGGWIKFF